MKGKITGVRLLTDTPLSVAPELVGLSIASPARRFLALAADYVLLLLPSLAMALSAALLSAWIMDPAALRAMATLLRNERPGSVQNRQALKDLAPLLVRLEAPGLPAEVVVAVEKNDLERAADVLSRQTLQFSLALEEAGQDKLGPGTVRVPIEKMIPRYARAGALYGIAALYFTLLTRSRQGATLGKRLLGIRVVHLNGERLGLLESFERFAGYLEIPATLGLGLVYLWHDPNRRLPHDRLAGTVVVRVQKKRKSEPKPVAKEERQVPEPSQGPEQI